MTEGSVSIEFLSDDSGAYPVVIKLLVRDANGDWYLGAPAKKDEPGEEPGEEPQAPKEVAEIDEIFSWEGYQGLVGWNQNSVVRESVATGFPWSGYSPTRGEVNPINSDENWSGRIKFEGTDWQGNYSGGDVPGNYVFTLFDSTGGNNPDQYINMSAGTLTLSLDVENAGENEEPYPAEFKILARDGNGNWFLSNEVQVDKGDNSIAFADLTWKQVKNNVAEWMNAMAGGDCADYGMATEDGEANPDLTKVTGGGVYISSITEVTDPETQKPSIIVAGIKWTADTAQ
jgi:hypothetical protein